MASLLQRVQSKLFVFAHRRTLNLLDGEYSSVFQGRSLDFDDLRAYELGDDVRDIDWKATARHGSPLIKRNVAVRRQRLLLVADTGAGLRAVARSGEPKRDLAVHALGVLGFLGLRHGDVVGLVHGDAATTSRIPFGGDEGHLERILQAVHRAAEPGSTAGPSGIGTQLGYVLRTFRTRMLVVIVADQVMPDAALAHQLRRLRARHEVLWFTIEDADLTAGDGRDSVDVAGTARIPAALADAKAVRAAYEAAEAEREQRRRKMFREAGVAEGGTGSSRTLLREVFALLERHRQRVFARPLPTTPRERAEVADAG